MADWYLRKSDGAEYGPAAIESLRQWAEDGRIAPEDHLSRDRTNWQPAPSVAGLEMQYEIVLENGDRYGPLHILALRELVEDGSIDTATPIRHADTGEVKKAGERLLAVTTAKNEQFQARIAELTAHNANLLARTEELADKNAILEARTEELTQQLAALEERLSKSPPEPPPKVKEKPGTSTVISRDPSFKDAQKWKALFETEHAQRLEVEDKLGAESKELRQQLHEAQSSRDRLSYRVNQLEKSLQEMQATLDGEGVVDAAPSAAVIESYQHLSDNYDTLLEQLREKTEEVDRLRDTRNEVEEEAATRIRQMEERLQREREEADTARHRLAELESTHMQIIRSFRDLNDRYIRLRQQTPSPSDPEPAPRQSEN